MDSFCNTVERDSPRGAQDTPETESTAGPSCWCITCGSMSLEELLDRGTCAACPDAPETCDTCYKHGLLCSLVSVMRCRERPELTRRKPLEGSDIYDVLKRVAAAFGAYRAQLDAGAGENDMGLLTIRDEFYSAQVSLSQHADSRMNHEHVEMQARVQYYDLVEKFLKGRSRGFAPVLRGMPKKRHEVQLRSSLSWVSHSRNEAGYQVVAAQQRGTFLKVPCAACAKGQGPMAECCVIIWNGTVWEGLRRACANCFAQRRHAACEVSRMGEVLDLCRRGQTAWGFAGSPGSSAGSPALRMRPSSLPARPGGVLAPPATPSRQKRSLLSPSPPSASSKRPQLSTEALIAEAKTLSLAATSVADL
ncbi:hypothetical protein PG984_011213 [Apiospora sp. TS-2023a]